ncbi:hypothetical protein SUDANB95_00652 [Actinosynnema sp. ALI-1.44]
MRRESITATELGRNPRPYPARVAAGETITVTLRGKPAARLAPPSSGTLFERLVLSGEIVPATAPRSVLFEPPADPEVSD